MEIIKMGRFPAAVIRTALLIDGTGTPPREKVDLYVENGVIRRIVPCRDGDSGAGNEDCQAGGAGNGSPGTKGAPFTPRADGRTGAPSRVVQRADGSGEIHCGDLTVLPGLVDCHVHLALNGVDFDSSLQRWENGEEITRRLAGSLENTLRAGILAVRDGGDRRLIGLMAACLAGGKATPPFIIATGRALRKKGKYGSFLGKGVTAPEIRAAVRETAASGAAQIKVLVSGIVSFREYGKVGPLQFSREELSLLVSEAHALGLKVMAHASSDEGTALAVACGVDSLEHGYFISRDTLARMAGRGIAWVPTIIPVAAQACEPLHRNHSPGQLALIEKTYRRQQVMVDTARRLGVIIGVGTDAGASGVRHGLSYAGELTLLAEAGLSPAEVTCAATAGGARILGLEKQIGMVAPDMAACLIGVRGNPLENPDVLKKPVLALIP